MMTNENRERLFELTIPKKVRVSKMIVSRDDLNFYFEWTENGRKYEVSVLKPKGI